MPTSCGGVRRNQTVCAPVRPIFGSSPGDAVQFAVVLTVLVLAFEGTASLGIAGLLDALQMADRAGAASQAGGSRLFDVQLTGLTRKPVQLQNGVQLLPAIDVNQAPLPDLVVVPGLDDEPGPLPLFELNRPWGAWIAKWYRTGAESPARAQVRSSFPTPGSSTTNRSRLTGYLPLSSSVDTQPSTSERTK